jgi:hypothetical protein
MKKKYEKIKIVSQKNGKGSYAAGCAIEKRHDNTCVYRNCEMSK